MKVLEIQFNCNTPFRDTLAQIRTYSRRITAIGKIKIDDIFTAILLRSLSDPSAPFHLRQAAQKLSHLPNISFEMTTKCILALDQVEPFRRRYEHELSQPVNRFTEVPLPNQSAFATNTRQSGPKPVCSNCKRDNHSTEYCMSPGGKMSGRTVKEARAAYRTALATSSTSSSDPSPQS
jgi:hypothetical protein